MAGRYLNNCWLLRTGHARKLPLLITFRKALGVGLKQHLWIYWISSVFVLSLVVISRAQFLTGLDMGMSHRPSVLFICPFKISILPLRILISFLSNMAIQSLSHSWHKEISKALCNPSNIFPFFYGCLDCFLGGVPCSCRTHCLVVCQLDFWSILGAF